eukprot:361174-Chlamydomonas_euryale.AAC.7
MRRRSPGGPQRLERSRSSVCSCACRDGTDLGARGARGMHTNCKEAPDLGQRWLRVGRGAVQPPRGGPLRPLRPPFRSPPMYRPLPAQRGVSSTALCWKGGRRHHARARARM